MARGDNVVVFSHSVARRSITRPRVVATISGALAASIAAFALALHFDALAPKMSPPSVQAVAPSIPPSATGQPLAKAASVAPCPNDSRIGVQTASSPKEAAAQRDAPAGPVSVANAVSGQGSVVVDGQATTADPQRRGKAEGSDKMTVASGAEAAGHVNVAAASAESAGCQ